MAASSRTTEPIVKQVGESRRHFSSQEMVSSPILARSSFSRALGDKVVHPLFDLGDGQIMGSGKFAGSGLALDDVHDGGCPPCPTSSTRRSACPGIVCHDLDSGPRALEFTTASQGMDTTWEEAPLPRIECDFWLACLQELEIGMEENSLATLAKVIAEWNISPP